MNSAFRCRGFRAGRVGAFHSFWGWVASGRKTREYTGLTPKCGALFRPRGIREEGKKKKVFCLEREREKREGKFGTRRWGKTEGRALGVSIDRTGASF